jgi:hypothetical protein
MANKAGVYFNTKKVTLLKNEKSKNQRSGMHT